MAKVMTMVRTKPVPRETRVPAAIRALEPRIPPDFPPAGFPSAAGGGCAACGSIRSSGMVPVDSAGESPPTAPKTPGA